MTFNASFPTSKYFILFYFLKYNISFLNFKNELLYQSVAIHDFLNLSKKNENKERKKEKGDGQEEEDRLFEFFF